MAFSKPVGNFLNHPLLLTLHLIAFEYVFFLQQDLDKNHLYHIELLILMF